MRSRFLTALFSVLFVYQTLSAQEVGLFVGTKLRPPFSPYIREYITLSDDFLNVQLKNTGTVPWKVTLRMVLENTKGVWLETKPNANLATYIIMPDKEVRLTGPMLKNYFEPENLLFKGLSAAAYKTGPLPSDLYTLRYDAYDADSGKLLAMGEPVQVWFVLNKAPSITFPEHKAELYFNENKHFYFEWSERHEKVTEVQRVDYEFRIVEIPNSFTGEVASIFHTLPVVYQQTLTTTSLMIDFSRVAMKWGRRYAFRVRAKVMSGKNELKLFENDGYSPVFEFTYKAICPTPVVAAIDFPGIHTAEIKWNSQPEVASYTFLIRDVKSANWERKDLTQPYMRLSTLDYEKTYEYKIRGYCKSYPGAYSKTYTLTLPSNAKPMMHHSRIRLTENATIRYNHSDTTVTISDRATKDSIRVDVRETVKRNVPVSIVDDEGNLFTLTPKRLK